MSMACYKITLEYDGSKYRGWQVQKESKTIQGECLTAVAQVLKTTKFDFQGSGRTDAGVHALAQVAHLQTTVVREPRVLKEAINRELPHDIHILNVEKSPDSFHARHDAVARSYLFQISTRRTAFLKKWVWWIDDPLDVEHMKSAGKLFIGLKDFRSFTPVDGESESRKVDLRRLDVVPYGDLILIRLVGSHFLWKMVRQVVGVLVEAGRGRLTEDDLAGFLRQYSDIPGRLTAPPSGLFLERVYYRGDRIPEKIQPALITAPMSVRLT